MQVSLGIIICEKFMGLWFSFHNIERRSVVACYKRL